MIHTVDMGSILGQEGPWEEGIETHSSIPARKTPSAEELQYMGLQRAEHDWMYTHTHTHTHSQRIDIRQLHQNSSELFWKN